MDIEIKGVKYKIVLLDKAAYRKDHKGSWAHLDRDDKIVYFRNDHINKKTVIHEITHCYLDACCIYGLELKSDDFEEIFCTLIENHIDDIRKTSNEVFRFLKESK